MEQIATVVVDVLSGGPSIKLDLYVDGLYERDKKYFVAPTGSYDPWESKTYVTDDEVGRLLKRMIT